VKRFLLDRLNDGLRRLNLRLETLTLEQLENGRLDDLTSKGHFEKPVLPLPDHLLLEADPIFEAIDRYRATFEKFSNEKLNDVGFSYENAYFSSPDVEALYAMIGLYRPRRIVEVGCGNSTRIMKQAILDFALDTQIVAIDPQPRVAVAALAHEVHASRVEDTRAIDIVGRLAEHDILFIDSSHQISMGNDVAFLYFNVLPALKPGVLVHVHDIFLPYEYPEDWVREHKLRFNEQTLLSAILQWSEEFEVLWAGYFLQRSRADFASHFPKLGRRRAQSFWMRKRNITGTSRKAPAGAQLAAAP
jgi:predicted O-methyltransferase YrrM